VKEDKSSYSFLAGMNRLARYIEHTNLSPTMTVSDVDRLVDEAKQHQFLGVCVPPFWVKRAQREIGNAPITLVTVAGFPLGYSMTETKLDEIKRAMDNGAHEVDVVLNISSFKTGYPWTKVEIAKCARLVHDHQKILKVILETAYLSEEEIVSACKPAGASVAHVKVMRASVPASVGIKASGGIKTTEQAFAFLEAGADRLGTSSGVNIVTSQLANS
jgi:deoxyribose-phosphate aldolase